MPTNEIRVDVRTSGIDALDRIAASMANIEKAVVKTEAPLTEHEKHLKHLAEEADRTSESIKKFGESIRQHVESPIGSVSLSLGKLAESMGTVGVAATATVGVIGAIGLAAFEAAKSLGELGTQTIAISIRTGLSTKEVGQFGFAAKAAGSDISSFETAMKMLSRGLSENSEEGKKAKAGLQNLGIATKDAYGEARAMSEIFVDVGEALRGMSSTAERNAMALAIFGRAGLELIPTLLKLKENLDVAKEAGIGMSQETAKHLEEYHQKVLLIEAAWEKAWRAAKIYFVDTAAWAVKGASGGVNTGGGSMGGGAPGELFMQKATPERSSVTQADMLNATKRLGVAPDPYKFILEQRQAQGRYNAAFVGPDIARYDRSKAGATANYEGAAKDEASARTAYFNAQDDPRISSSKLQDLKKDWVEATAEVKKYQGQLDAITAAEQELQRIAAKQVSTENQAYAARRANMHPLSAIESDRVRDLSVETDPETRGNINSRANWQLRAEMNNQIKKALSDVGAYGATIGARDAASLAYDSKNYAKGLKDTGTDLQAAQDEDFAVLATQAARESSTARRESQQRVRLTQLATVGQPGGEGRAVAVDYQERLNVAKQIRDIERAAGETRVEAAKHAAEYDFEILHARRDYELAIAEIRSRQREQDRSAAGSVFDAIMQGGSGMQNLMKGFAMNTGRTIFQNATQSIFTAGRGALAGIGGDGPLGKLLQGTVFGSDPVKDAQKANTDATVLNTAATLALAKGMGVDTGSIPGAAGLGSLASSVAGPGVGSIFSAGSSFLNMFRSGASSGSVGDIAGGAPGIAGAVDWATSGGSSGGGTRSSMTRSSFGSSFGGGPNLVGTLFTPAGESVSTGDGSATVNTNAARVGSAAAIGGTLYAGYQGISAGIKEGGARGTVHVIGSAAATAAALDPEPISKAALEIAALTAQIIGGIMGDPKQMRSAQITRNLKYNAYTAPVALNESIDTSGNYSDYDRSGNARSSPFSGTPQVSQYYSDYKHNTVVPGTVNTPYGPPAASAQPIVVQVQTMDAKSFLDHSENIAAAVARDFQTNGIVLNAMRRSNLAN